MDSFFGRASYPDSKLQMMMTFLLHLKGVQQSFAQDEKLVKTAEKHALMASVTFTVLINKENNRCQQGLAVVITY